MDHAVELRTGIASGARAETGDATHASVRTASTPHASSTHVDVLVVGAGISGISAGYYLQTRCPRQSYAILDAREGIGGTWDLFRYPGIRSDSDLYTFGFSFRPWRSDKAIADGAAILDYVLDTAKTYRIDEKIRFGHRVVRAAWDSRTALWGVDVKVGPQRRPARFTCRFLYMCSGYYDYETGYMPGWPQMERFGGRIVHPQHWPQDLDYAGKRVVVIGSGATAVTLVPALAASAAHVTMLQRSPSYVVALPSEDKIAGWLRRKLPAGMAHTLTRWKNVLLVMYFYGRARKKPEQTKARILGFARAQLGKDYDLATHFTPRYKPWDQRMCLAPDGDLFTAIRKGSASVVTDTIEHFTDTGLRLGSGRDLEADIVVAATGLTMKLLGGVSVTVDGVPVELPSRFVYKGMMFSDVPNLALALGYTNNSWTLKCELTSRYVCRLLNHMQARRLSICVPRGAEGLTEDKAWGLTSGYVMRAAAILPKQADRKPWKLHQNYARDLAALKYGALRDGVMTFTRTETTENAAA